jgi:hypothetical protein
VRTDELIVQLARDARPVRPLPGPSVRLARWTAAILPLTAMGVLVVGPRKDVLTATLEPAFLGMALGTLCTALLAASSALVLSVPGAERSPVQRVAPLLAGGLCSLALMVGLTSSGETLPRLFALPFHRACFIEIVAFSVVPGWVLFAMVRRAAPLRRAWAGALAMLGAVAIGAVATQFICPLDDPAHHLVGHVVPVAALSVFGAIAGHRHFTWLPYTIKPLRTA